MALDNAAIAQQLEAFASLLDLSDASFYTVRAYRRAAELVRTTQAPIEALVRAGRVRELSGIGPGIEARLRELVETGEIAELRELEREVTPELVGLGRLVGLAPKRAVEIGKALGATTAAEFRDAALAGRLQTVPGVGPKTEAQIVAALAEEAEKRPRRGLLLNRSRALVGEIASALGGELAGDPRRWRDSSERLAVVCAATNPEPVLAAFASLAAVVAVVEREARRAVGVTVEGVPVELVVAEPARFGTELLRATGSSEYVRALEPLPDAPDEASLYAALGIPFCPPELREQPFRGEPPALVEVEDIRGDLHAHTTWSDGRASVLEMGVGARDRGYEYLAICDHTPNVRVVPGLDADAVRRQAEEIAVANAELAPFRILRGIECDIRADGALDLPDDVLAELDWVQLSLHAGQRGERHEPVYQPPARERARPRPSFRGGARDGSRGRGERTPRPARPARRARSPRDRSRRPDRVLDGRAFDRRSREHAALGRDRPARLGDRGPRPQHAAARGNRLARDAARPARRPLGELEPVRVAKGLGHLRLGVGGVEDVPLEVAADRDRAQRHVRQVHERLGREVRLRDRVVLELEIGGELHQERPVRAGARAHAVGSSAGAPISSLDHWPSRRRTPRSEPSAQTTKVAASSSQW